VPEILPLSAAPHFNHQLFSDHYLNRTLPQRADWVALQEAAAPVREAVAALFAGFTPSDNEAQTEEGWIKPVLKVLGQDFEVQPALKTPDGTKRPDYVFYRTGAALIANKGKTLTEDLLKTGGYAVGDAKYWDRSLDAALQGKSIDVFSNKNPGYQIAFYMQHSGLEWGILTNGRLWRLYHRDTAHKLDRYYEVDLPALLENPDPAAFLYFYAFFRRAAFEPGPLGVRALLHESRDYAQGVGDTLKGQVYEALRHLAQGFLDYVPNGLVSDAETRKTIYDNSLILLYRLLFVLYAEARELLPVSASPAYRDSYSLYALKRSVAANLDAQQALLATTAKLWPSLKELFGIIDKGSPPLQVATFNGGLFDPKRHGFLDTKPVGDAHLQVALDKLSRVGGEFVDYRDLSVRHLGTIYEGLLEYHLDALPAEDKDTQDGWSVALLNDKGERKATGSYYTPDYIVKYIVEQAVGPMLDAAVAGVTDNAAQAEAVLQVNVLDPAMGSGHFLVETTEFIARYLIDLAIAPGQDGQGESDLLYWKRRVAQSCVYGVDLNPLAVELAKLSLWLTTVAKDRPLSFLDHHLRTGNALVGARLADLQLGGAKPKAKKQAAEPGQMTMMADESFRQSLSVAVGSMWLIEGSAAQTVADVKQQEKLYETLRAGLTRKYSRLANLVTASHFGVVFDKAFWNPLSAYALDPESASHPKFAEWANAADAAASRLRFFHWELEFPEVYFGTDGKSLGDNAGFDAVVGNPPYVQQEELGPYKPFFAAGYPQVSHGVADLSVYFLGQGLRQLQQGGVISFITSGTFRKLNFGAPLRQYLVGQTTLMEMVDFGEQQVFTDATTYPVILQICKSPPEPGSTFTLTQPVPKTERFQQVGQVKPPSGSSAWVFTTEALRHIVDGWEGSLPLGEVLSGSPYRGVTTGLNEAFVVPQQTRDSLVADSPETASLLKAFIRGEDLHPWYQVHDGLWLITLPNDWTQKQFEDIVSDADAWNKLEVHYPALAQHLLRYETQGRIRQDQGRYWWELRPCNYYSAFEQPRIHSTKVSLFPKFSLSDETSYAGNTSYVLPVPDMKTGYYLLGLLNSHVCEYFCRSVFAAKANGYYEVQPEPLSRFPTPNAPDADRDAIGTLALEITAEAKKRYALHEKVRQRLQTDFGSSGTALNQKLTAWWSLDFPGLRRELVKVFKRDIPVKERDDWQEWFEAQTKAHTERTSAIVARETDLNARVYALFKLKEAEIALIEAATKYQYGEV
jgi:hypothetical protein